NHRHRRIKEANPGSGSGGLRRRRPRAHIEMPGDAFSVPADFSPKRTSHGKIAERGRPEPSSSASGRLSGLAAGKPDGRGAGAVVGIDVDKADHALLDLVPGALQRRADVLRVLDIFGVAAQGLGHLVVARVAEVAAGLVALGVGGPAAV